MIKCFLLNVYASESGQIQVNDIVWPGLLPFVCPPTLLSVIGVLG